MAKGSVRKKGKKWYYRYYVEDASGNRIQKECVGTESKAETEKLLREAIKDFEEKQFVAKTNSITLGDLLDMWAEEDLKVGTLSNGTVDTYLHAIRKIKEHPIADRKLKTVTAEHLQQYMDLLIFGGKAPDGTEYRGFSKDYVRSFSAVLNRSFKFAVFPKTLITFNPMQYVVMHNKAEDVDIFATGDDEEEKISAITHEQFLSLVSFLERKENPAVLPIQIAYYAGLRIGEACALTWNDINLDEQYLTVRRSVRRNSARKKVELGTTKRKKIRTVDFGDTLTDILKKARKEQLKNRMKYGELGYKNYYKEVVEKNRTHYELYAMPHSEDVPEDYHEIGLVCTKLDGAYTSSEQVASMCRSAAKKVDGLDGFHFHCLRHSYTTNLITNGASPKDVQELLGHSDVSTTMNVYAHSNREAKRSSARLLDKVAGND